MNDGECATLSEMPCALTLKNGCPWGSVVGSGKSGTPWVRMHRANLSMTFSSSRTTVGEQSPAAKHCCSCCWTVPPVAGIRCWQARWAAWSRELLTPSCCALALAIPPSLGGSGKFGIPCERTHWE